MVSRRPAIFLDRDGVLCEYKEEIIELNDFILKPDIGRAVAKLNQAGFWVFIVTNQPQIAKGNMSVAQLDKQHELLIDHLKLHGAHVDKIYYCPHRVGGKVKDLAFDCDCRKPKPGMILQAAKEFDVDLKNSIMIGDTWRDAECAFNAELPCIGVEGGGGYPYAASSEGASKRPPLKIVKNLNEAVEFVLTKQVKI